MALFRQKGYEKIFMFLQISHDGSKGGKKWEKMQGDWLKEDLIKIRHIQKMGNSYRCNLK